MIEEKNIHVVICLLSEGARIRSHRQDINGHVFFDVVCPPQTHKETSEKLRNGTLKVDAKRMFLSERIVRKILKSYAEKPTNRD